MRTTLNLAMMTYFKTFAPVNAVGSLLPEESREKSRIKATPKYFT